MKFIGTYDNALNYKKENNAWLVEMDENNIIHGINTISEYMHHTLLESLTPGLNLLDDFSQEIQERLNDRHRLRNPRYILVNPVFEGQFIITWKKEKKEARLNLIGAINGNDNIIGCMKSSPQSLLDMTMHIMMNSKPDKNGIVYSVQKFILNNRTSCSSIKRYG